MVATVSFRRSRIIRRRTPRGFRGLADRTCGEVLTPDDGTIRRPDTTVARMRIRCGFSPGAHECSSSRSRRWISAGLSISSTGPWTRRTRTDRWFGAAVDAELLLPAPLSGAGAECRVGVGSCDAPQCVEALLQAAADCFAKRVDGLVGDPVAPEVALLAAGDDARALEQDEVLGDVLLRRANECSQLEHRGLAFAEPVEQPDPRRLGQRAQALGDQLDQLVGERMRHRGAPAPSVPVGRGDDSHAGVRLARWWNENLPAGVWPKRP